MKIARFTEGGNTRLGLVVENGLIDLAQEAPDLPKDMLSFIQAGNSIWDKARSFVNTTPHFALDQVTLEAPIPNPGKVLAIGLNYGDHIEESGMPAPEVQLWFNKQSNCITGPGETVEIPAVAPDFIDYEAELVMVIGRYARHVPRDRASEVIFGYTCGNDVSARDWQRRSPTFTMGKSFETHGPIGPWIVTADEFGNPHDTNISCTVNGDERQSSNTKHLIFDCFDQIEHLTAAFPLEPGDLIFTGTPDGVGAAMKPAQFLKVGDTVRVDIERIGTLENKMIAGTNEVVIK